MKNRKKPRMIVPANEVLEDEQLKHVQAVVRSHPHPIKGIICYEVKTETEKKYYVSSDCWNALEKAGL